MSTRWNSLTAALPALQAVLPDLPPEVWAPSSTWAWFGVRQQQRDQITALLADPAIGAHRGYWTTPDPHHYTEIAAAFPPAPAGLVADHVSALHVKTHAFSLIVAPTEGLSLYNAEDEAFATQMLEWIRERCHPRGVVCLQLPLASRYGGATIPERCVRILRWHWIPLRIEVLNSYELAVLAQPQRFGPPVDDWADLLRPPHPHLPLARPVQLPAGAPVRPWWSQQYSLQALADRLDASTFAETVIARHARKTRRPTTIPPLPLKIGHLALQLASGRFDGVVGTGTHRHVVKGRVHHTQRSDAEPGGTRIRDNWDVQIDALTPDGAFRHWSAETPEEASE